MQVLIFLLVVGIASAVFYFFLKKAFELPFNQAEGDRDQVEIKPVKTEETKEGETSGQKIFGMKDETQQNHAKTEDISCQWVADSPQCSEEEKSLNQQE